MIYLDHNATTPIAPPVLEAMLPFLREQFGNASSRHDLGTVARRAVEQAREQVAAAVGVQPAQVVFTSGGTEANNLLVKGAAAARAPAQVAVSAIEHPCVLEPALQLRRQGWTVAEIGVDAEGVVRSDALAAALRVPTGIVSVMLANNETGAIQPVAALAEQARAAKAVMHTDAVQAFGKIPVLFNELNVQAMSLSSHKIYGPKGAGALVVDKRLDLQPLLAGGGHERGMRSGTLPTHQIVGMGEAFRIAKEEMAAEGERIRMLRDRLWKGLSQIEEVYVNGDMERRVPHNLNVSFNFVEGESLIMAIKDVAVSSGSACTSASLEPSYVLRALGRSDELAHSSIRFTVGRFTTPEEIDYTVDLLKRKVAKLRELSPLWEMHQEGVDLNSVQWAAQ